MEASVFLSYAPEDLAHRDVLIRHLDPLRRAGSLRLWHDGHVKAGADRAAAVRAELDRAVMALLLVSADYLGSEDCRAEMERALERARASARSGTSAMRVVPVLLRPCLHGVERISKLAALPANGRPVTVWRDRDSAWNDVAHRIATLLGGALSEPPAEAPAERAEVERLRLLAKLEDARVRRRRLETVRGTTVDVDTEILKLKRDLREGGQVRQGDLLRARYTLLRRIGRGGFATVWEAEDREAHARVAIKILHPDLAGDTVRRERFFRGARIMSELGHEAIVRILSTEQVDGGFHYLVMEHMAGGDLQAAMLEGHIPPDRVVPLIVRVGEALTAAHEHSGRYIHRDVKPANVLLDEEGNPKLGDFDLVGGRDTTGGTGTGPMGSFVYAAPEMLSHPQDADERADVFGLGMTALFCLFGKPLTDEAFFDPRSLLEKLDRPAVAAVVAKAVDRTPSQRFADVRSFCAELRVAEASERETRAARANERRTTLPASDILPSQSAFRSGPSNLGDPQPPTKAEALPASTAVVTVRPEIPPEHLGHGPTSGGLPLKESLRHIGQAGLVPRKASGKIVMGAAMTLIAVAASVYGIAHAFGSGTRTWGPPVSQPGVCPADMVQIVPEGQLWIGSEDGVGSEDEHPRHPVVLKPYCMDKVEVTVEAYSQCAEHDRCDPAPTTDSFCNGNNLDRRAHPVNCVSFDEALTYCNAVGRRLPSGDEWEFAARGPEERMYPWGTADPFNQLCWDGLGNGLGQGNRHATCAVGKYPQGNSPFELSDMAGNVWEWTSDAHCSYGSNVCDDAERVVRGGGWKDYGAFRLRSAFRLPVDRGDHASGIGFRCARDL